MATDVTQDRLAGTWNFSPVHSAATFSVDYLVASFSGAFSEVEATLADGKLSGEVKVASIVVKDENLAAHLLAPDFFDGEQHPTISFASDTLAIDGDDLDARRRADAQGRHEGGPRDRQGPGPDRGLHGQHAPGLHALRRRSTAPPTASAGTPICPRAARRWATT